MKSINPKTIQDLEFQTVLETVSGFCLTSLGKTKTLEIKPFSDQILLNNSLAYTSEYTASFENGNAFPNHNFEDLTKEIRFLAIEDSYLEAEVLLGFANLSRTANGLLNFLKKFKEYYPKLYERSENVTYTDSIIQKIEAKIDRFALVKDDASPLLYDIRQELKIIRGKINQSFQLALSSNISNGYLDDIKESVIDNTRVLAVLAMHKRKVKGSILGTSKTGSIVYIEPESTLKLTRELNNLLFEEKEEIKKILKLLASELQIFVPLLYAYQDLLSDIDLTYAKAKYAQKINGILPEITNQKRLFFREAYHPILLLNNRTKKQPVYPQTIELTNDNRIIVISGPNAGGKSITLKTIGLLQLMLQSGLLIPVHPKSSTFLFDRILTDIGDNQSIENHLSTYSYRLKNMNYFLKKCNHKTLILIDEFGTGSDPELGGALAEVFLEEFYNKEAFGIITTHYTNLKILANELPFASNANMLFDEKSLEPLYKLILGQAGSSFTFEVAQKNGIPYGLINRAKKKIEKSKIRFDQTITTLQKERSKLEKTSQNLKEEESKVREESKRLEDTNLRIRQKLESFQELYDSNQRLIYLGQRLDDLSEKYFNNKDKKTLIGELLKIVEIENSKRKKLNPRERRQKESEEKTVQKEVQAAVEQIREKKKEERKKKQDEEKNKPKVILKVGDRVRIIGGKALGTIEKIEKNKAFINYGLFTSQTPLEQLERV